MIPAGPSRTTHAAVVALFFLSGISGLVYQVIWVRELGNVFGNTVHSAALVTGVFMSGLGAGSFVLGRYADRRHGRDPGAPLRLYGLSELGIAAFGLALALLLPHLAGLSASVSSYAKGAHGWYEPSTGTLAFRYAAAVLLLAPPTFLMGGTLTLLIRYLVARDLRSAGVRIGLLYGMNTAGAALGALFTDFLLVPRLGLFRTQLVAVGLNAAAGLGALVLASRQAQRTATSVEESARAAGGEDANRSEETIRGTAQGRRTVALTGASLGLSGFAAMGLEILWFRYLSGTLGSLRAVFSLLLAVLLAGIWLGSVGGGYLERKVGRPVLLFVAAQGLLAVSTLALLGAADVDGRFAEHLDRIHEAFVAAGPRARALMSLSTDLGPILLVTGLPALLMGFGFPLANACVQRAEGAVGGRAGALYLANTLGNVLGSVLVGFLLLPAVGMKVTVMVLAACAALAPLPIGLAARSRSAPEGEKGRPLDLGLAVALGIALVALAGFSQLPAQWLLRGSLPRGDEGGTRQLIEVSEGLNETVAITEVKGFSRSLHTNGHVMSSTAPGAQRYMRAFAHLPLLQMEAPKSALVICFGVGNTLHAASLHPSIERLELADLSRNVLEHAPWFEAANHDVLHDGRVSVFVDDGRHRLLLAAPGSYDLITLEPPPLAFAGVGALYSHEFYALARSRLAPGGYLTEWLPSYQIDPELALSIVRAFLDVFPESVLLSGDDRELMLMGTVGPSVALDPDAVARRIHAAPAVEEDLRRIDLGSLTEIAGTFVASRETLVRATRGAVPLTDDEPLLEYGELSTLHAIRQPAGLFDVSDIASFCPRCFDHGEPRAEVAALPAYLRVTGALYSSEAFLVETYREGVRQASLPALATPEAQATIATSPYFIDLISGAPERRVGAAHLARGEIEDAVGAFRHEAFLHQTDPEAWSDLGEAELAARHGPEAADAFTMALSLSPRSARAHRGMTMTRELGHQP
jgi:spermidine synthase